MNKEKLKHLPFNFLWCIASFILPFFILNEIANMNTLASIGIAFYIYILDVKWHTDTDYLSEKIKKLEDANVPDSIECKISFTEWFEQFKNN
jgi:hypothetical protein